MRKTGNHGAMLASACAALAAAACVALLYCALKAVNFDASAMENPSGQLGRGGDAARYGELAMLFDIAFYLLQLPVAVYLAKVLRRSEFYVDFSAVAGVMYLLTGMIGAATLSVAWPLLASLYDAASAGPDRNAITAIYRVVTDTVEIGVWGRVEYVLCATWAGGLAIASFPRHKILSVASMFLSTTALLSWIACMAGDGALASSFINAYILASIIWLLVVSVFAAFASPAAAMVA